MEIVRGVAMKTYLQDNVVSSWCDIQELDSGEGCTTVIMLIVHLKYYLVMLGNQMQDLPHARQAR